MPPETNNNASLSLAIKELIATLKERKGKKVGLDDYGNMLTVLDAINELNTCIDRTANKGIEEREALKIASDIKNILSVD